MLLIDFIDPFNFIAMYIPIGRFIFDFDSLIAVQSQKPNYLSYYYFKKSATHIAQ